MSPSASPNTNKLPTRKIAMPTGRYIQPIDSSDLQNLIESFEPLHVADPHCKPPNNNKNAAANSDFCAEKPTEEDADLAASWFDWNDIQKAHLFEEEVKRRRDQSYGELLDLLDTITVRLRSGYSEDFSQSADSYSLIRLSPVKLATAWEKETWCSKYTTAYDLNDYNQAMATDIADLQIWIKYWGDSPEDPPWSEGEDMFRERFHRQFKNRVAELMVDEEVGSRSDAVSNWLASVDAEQEQTAPFSQLSASEIDFDFAGEPVVFGAANTKDEDTMHPE